MWVVVGLVVGGGMMFSGWDYRRWRYEEMKNYGQGWAVNARLAPAGKLEGPYMNTLVKLRMRYPEGWKAQENEKLGDWVVSFKEPAKSAELIVWRRKTSESLEKIVEKEAEGVTRDREYFGTETASWIMLTWEEENRVRQKVIAKRGDVVWILELTCARDVWAAYAKTLEAVYKSVVLL